MSKTVAEIAQELGVTKQYLNRILNKYQLGSIKGNKRIVSENEFKSLLSILNRHSGNSKSETSFHYLFEEFKIRGQEIERLHKLLDQSQQLLLNEQKKNKLLIEANISSESRVREKKIFIAMTILGGVVVLFTLLVYIKFLSK